MITRIFTFGHGQHCPFTGKHLLDHYVTITAPTAVMVGEVMGSMFGEAWSAEYDGPDDPKIADWLPQWTEHARIVIAKRTARSCRYDALVDYLLDPPTPLPPCAEPAEWSTTVVRQQHGRAEEIHTRTCWNHDIVFRLADGYRRSVALSTAST